MTAITRAFIPSKPPAGPENFAIGLLRIGDATVALPVENTREVVPCPAQLEVFPSPSPWVLGALVLRGVIIPVIDPGLLLGIKPENHVALSDRIVVVVRQEGRLVGLIADGVGEIVSGKSHELQPLHVTANGDVPTLVTHTLPVNGKVVCILDAARLAALPGLPTVPEHASRRGSIMSGFAEPKLFFETSGMRFGIDAISIEATVPVTGLGPSPLQSALCAGVIEHQGRQIPVIDTLFALGFGTSYAGEKDWSILIVKYPPEGSLGILISNVHRIYRHFPADIMDIPFGLASDTSLFCGSVIDSDNSTDYLLLDVKGLRNEPRLKLLANTIPPKPVRQQTGVVSTVAANGARGVAPFLLFARAGRYASPLTQIKEIVEFPEAYNAVVNGRRGLIGYYCHRGSTIAIYDFCKLAALATADHTKPGKLLVVQYRDHLIGIAVNDIQAVETGRLRKADDNASEKSSVAGRQFMPDKVVEIETGGKKQLVSFIDFIALFEPISASHDAREAPQHAPWPGDSPVETLVPRLVG